MRQVYSLIEMELRHLTYAVAVADAGSFTGAARDCHVAQSALSKQVGQLEAELGTQLFERTTRHVALTPAGEVFIPAARKLLAAAKSAVAQVRDLAGVATGDLRLGATQTASRTLDVAATLGRFHQHNLQVGLSVLTGPRQELLTAVAAGDLDIALTASGPLEPASGALHFQPLRPRQPLVAIVASTHPLARRKRATLAELADRGAFLEFRRGTELRRLLDEAFQHAGIDRAIAFELGHLSELARCAAHGLGTAIVPSIFAADLDPMEATALALHGTGLAVTIGAYTRAGDRSTITHTALRQFSDVAERHRHRRGPSPASSGAERRPITG